MNATILKDKLQDQLSRLTLWQGVLLAVLAAGLYATVLRFSRGLGAVTNLSDSFPWGLWIGFDILVGVGLAAGGFVVAATVHVFRMERYEAIARPAVLTAFLGYVLVIVALLFDLGRPYRIWHPLVMWNPHSVMFEVAWCVTLYTTVLALEFSPLVFERFGWKRPLKVIRTVFVPLVIVGVLLSTLHQSSLGSLYVIVPDKLHGLWYTPLLPVFFFLSAVAAGLAMTIFESFMSYRAFGKRLEPELLAGIARVIVVVLGVYTLIKIQDLTARGNLGLAFAATPESVLFWGEAGLGVLLPMALFALRRVRRSEGGLFFAALLTVMGFIINRLNVAVTGMTASSGVSYIPSWMEFAVTVSIVGVGLVLFALAVKYLPIFPKEELPPPGVDPVLLRRRPALSRPVLVGLWTLLAIGILGMAATQPKHSPPKVTPVKAAAPAVEPGMLRLPKPYTFPVSGDSPGAVTFDHETHAMALDNRCQVCHAALFRLTVAGRPVSGKLSYEAIHEGRLCASCHDGKQAFAIDADCTSCHRQ
jgi:c(7)-type cytochrome triheme protein